MYTHGCPEDSVLRRHYEQLQQASAATAKAAARPAAASSAPQAAPTRPGPTTPAPASPPSAAQDLPGNGGLFAWLRRLFGG